jgi:DNA-binding NtrC family response regulator
MPARVVVVHDDPDFGMAVGVALKAAGYEVATFPDSMDAMDALYAASRIEVLVAGGSFAPGAPTGAALARAAWSRRPRIRVLFMTRSDLVLFTEGTGELLGAPVEIASIVEAVQRILPPSRGKAD